MQSIGGGGSGGGDSEQATPPAGFDEEGLAGRNALALSGPSIPSVLIKGRPKAVELSFRSGRQNPLTVELRHVSSSLLARRSCRCRQEKAKKKNDGRDCANGMMPLLGIPIRTHTSRNRSTKPSPRSLA